jgi:Holliday junction resolvasome RuvABC endonuclease subunit
MKIKLSVFMIVMTSITGSMRTHIYKSWSALSNTDAEKTEGTWQQSFDMFLINSVVLGGVYLIFLSLDPGLRNLAFCLIDKDGEILEVGRTDVYQGAKIEIATTCEYITQWCENHSHLFDGADLVVIEKQFQDNKITLSSCLLIVQTVLQVYARKRPKVVILHAMTIKNFFKTVGANHRKNKAASVECAMAFEPSLRSRCPKDSKLDDICDAYLMCLYAIRNLINDPIKSK